VGLEIAKMQYEDILHADATLRTISKASETRLAF
jgi:hypothetical protein